MARPEHLKPPPKKKRNIKPDDPRKTKGKAPAKPFLKGNQVWMQCEFPGVPKLYKTPEELWLKAVEYFEWCNSNPLESIEYYGKDATMCEVPKMRAYTITGLELYLCISSLRDYRDASKPTYKAFQQVITRIEKTIYTQKFEGASAGLLNANIIARDLGLTDKQEITQTKFKVSRKG